MWFSLKKIWPGRRRGDYWLGVEGGEEGEWLEEDERVDHNYFSPISQIRVGILQTTAGYPNPWSFYIAKGFVLSKSYPSLASREPVPIQ